MNNDFDAIATSFENQLRESVVTPSTDVELVFHAITQSDESLISFRISIAPTVKVKFNDSAFGRKFASGVYLDAILGNIDALVRNSPTEFCLIADSPIQEPVRIQSFELKIIHP